MQVLLDGPTEKALGWGRGGHGETPWSRRTPPPPQPTNPHLAALAGDAAVVVAGGFVPAHHALFIFVQVARDVPWGGNVSEPPFVLQFPLCPEPECCPHPNCGPP